MLEARRTPALEVQSGHWFTKALQPSAAYDVPPPCAEATFRWVLRPEDGTLEPDWTVYTDGSCLDGPTALLRRTGWALVALDAVGTVRASANGVPPQWVDSIFGAESWAILQVVTHAVSPPKIHTDCLSALTVIAAGRALAVGAGRKTARAWTAFFAATDDVPLQDIAWMPAHTSAADIGIKMLSNGTPLSWLDRRGNELADELAKKAVAEHRVPAAIRRAVEQQEREVTRMAWWIARATVSANAWGPQSLRDSMSAPRGPRRRNPGATRLKKAKVDFPMVLGGHDIRCDWKHLARPWQCRCCHRTAVLRSTLSSSRCSGSAALRWAVTASTAADAGMGTGGGHVLLLTGGMCWCWRCGAHASVRAHNLLKTCPGWAVGSRVFARQRLLLGLHPGTRVPIGVDTVPEPGMSLPPGFSSEVRAAALSATRAAHTVRSMPRAEAVVVPAASFGTARLDALRARVREREAAAAADELGPGPLPKRVRLWGTQPPLDPC